MRGGAVLVPFGDHGAWGLFSRPPERAHELCAGPGHHVAVRVGAASGLYRPGSAGIRASASPKRFTERADALRVERDATIELAARALRFRDENTGRFVIASTSYCTTALATSAAPTVWTIISTIR
jgi:hypothetical protein